MTPICLNSPKVISITPNRNLNSPKVIFVTLGVIFPVFTANVKCPSHPNVFTGNAFVERG